VLDRLGVIEEPYARGMLSPSMAAVVSVASRLPRSLRGRWVTLAGCAGAVQWFDAHVIAALDDGVDQVATIGAGYDTRAWRFARSGVRFFELDLATTQADKLRRAPAPGPVHVAADLTTDRAADALIAAGLDAERPTIFVFEGLTMYLDAPTLRRQLSELAATSAPGSRLVADFYPPKTSGTSQNRRQLLLQRVARVGSGEPLTLQIDRSDAVDLVEESGWQVDELLGFREAARRSSAEGAGLPVDAVNDAKTLLAARVG
jgi:methyltransferase (TIGR00027 family)